MIVNQRRAQVMGRVLVQPDPIQQSLPLHRWLIPETGVCRKLLADKAIGIHSQMIPAV
jgi:hypothetical protein